MLFKTERSFNIAVGLLLCGAQLLWMLFLYNTCFAADYTTTRARVREYLYEPSSTNSVYSDTLLNESIDKAQDFLLDMMPVSAHYNMQTLYTTTTTASTSAVALPSDFRNVLSVKVGTKQAWQIKANDFHNSVLKKATTNDPAFYIMNTSLMLYPTPTDSTTAVELLYVKKPNKWVTDGTTISLLDIYLPLVALEAARYVLMQDNQANRAAAVEKLLISEMQAVQIRQTNTNNVEATTK